MRPATPPQRVVLDTNVPISALVFPSPLFYWLKESWQTGIILPLVTFETAGELIEVLGESKFGLSPTEQAGLLAEYLPWCETVTVVDLPPVAYCRDQDDLSFLQLALVGEAEYLVTGDSDLLALASEFSIPVIRPASLRDLLLP